MLSNTFNYFFQSLFYNEQYKNGCILQMLSMVFLYFFISTYNTDVFTKKRKLYRDKLFIIEKNHASLLKKSIRN